jgi:hypothetical protein
MTLPSQTVLLLGVCAMTGCASPRVMTVDMGGNGTDVAPCFAEVDGRRVPLDGFAEFARRWRGREAHLRSSVNTPYRCMGRIIYELQRVGFRRIGFIAEPALEPAPAR